MTVKVIILKLKSNISPPIQNQNNCLLYLVFQTQNFDQENDFSRKWLLKKIFYARRKCEENVGQIWLINAYDAYILTDEQETISKTGTCPSLSLLMMLVQHVQNIHKPFVKFSTSSISAVHDVLTRCILYCFSSPVKMCNASTLRINLII